MQRRIRPRRADGAVSALTASAPPLITQHPLRCMTHALGQSLQLLSDPWAGLLGQRDIVASIGLEPGPGDDSKAVELRRLSF